MNREVKKAILEIRKAEREQKIAAIHARIETRRAEHEQKRNAIHARIKARRAERYQRKTGETSVKAVPNPMMANVPTIHFPEDDPKYNSARKYG